MQHCAAGKRRLHSVVNRVRIVHGRLVTPKRAESIFSGIQETILSGFRWLYLLAVAIFLFSMIFLAFSRYGELKLGPEDSEPEFR